MTAISNDDESPPHECEGIRVDESPPREAAYRRRKRNKTQGRRAVIAFLAGEKIRECDLARMCGVKKSAISDLVTGATRYPKVPLLIALWRVAGIHPVAWVTK